MAFNTEVYGIFISILVLLAHASAQLSTNYYATTCPKALATIRSAVTNAVAKEHRMGASLLRLHFHDCFVNGCDASILLDDTSSFTGEKTAGPNANSIRGYEVIDAIKSQVESVCPGVVSCADVLAVAARDSVVVGCDASILLDDTSSFTGEKTAGPNANSIRGYEVIDAIKSQVESVCPGVVSCADVLAVAARDSVVVLGGPSWAVKLGRRDSTTASYSAANTDLPSPLMDLTDLISSFSNKGFSVPEMVALAGSHTIGQARCLMFRQRLYNESSIDSILATSLKSNCPNTGSDDNLSPLDATTPVIFDNAYFRTLVNKGGLLHSDQQLFSGGSTDSHVTTYSLNSATFYKDFAAAMIKMGNLGPLTGTNGEIRTDCKKVN